jgi:hypothetical protein
MVEILALQHTEFAKVNNQSCKQKALSLYGSRLFGFGGNVWESNPPATPRAAHSVLKTVFSISEYLINLQSLGSYEVIATCF